MGWKDNEVIVGSGNNALTYDDIKQSSTSLSREEGQTEEALIESGEAEGVYKSPDRYILSFDRRLDTEEEVSPGFKDSNVEVTVKPKKAGARMVTLSGCSEDISIKYDTTDGVVAHYEYKTKGAVDSDGNLTDIAVGSVAAAAAGGGEEPAGGE